MDASSRTHASLLQRLRAGQDEPAWDEFCQRYGAVITGFARRQGLQAVDCEDVLQDVLAALTRALPQFAYDAGKGSFRGYLKTVTLHAIARRRQKDAAARLGQEVPSGLGSDSGDPAASEAFEAEWRQHHIRTAMRTIDAEFRKPDRDAFELYAVAGRDAATTATTLGLSVEQVYQAKSRILRRLRELIEAQVEDEG